MDALGYLSVVVFTLGVAVLVAGLASSARASRVDDILPSKNKHLMTAAILLGASLVLLYVAGRLAAASDVRDIWHGYVEFLGLWPTWPFPTATQG